MNRPWEHYISNGITSMFHQASRRSAMAMAGGSLAMAYVLACGVSAVQATSIAPESYSVVQDSNWVGYAATTTSNSQTFTSVVGSWQVPALTGPSTGNPTYASFWVGLDGFGNSTVEQLGTSSTYTPGTGASYDAWYEMFPQFSIAIPGMTITPGDWMNASVTYEGNETYRLTMQDTTTGSLFTIDQLPVPGFNPLRSTAEWVGESPGVNGSLSSLANFGSTTFLGAAATLDGTDTGTISSFSTNTGIQLISGTGGLSATPSPLNADGNGFTIAVGSSAPPGTTLTASGNVGMLTASEFISPAGAVPEPSSLPEMGLGLAGMLLLLKPRRRSH
jgi:hypothetical protein